MGLIALYTVLLFAFTIFAVTSGFNYDQDTIRGVNLGGWLVLEPWITPSLFDNTGNSNIVDEYTFCLNQPIQNATDALWKHWDRWITEEDFKEIAEAGLNHVRLPIGYWAFDTSADEPYVMGQVVYLEKAVAWAGNHGLKVIIDLHGVPGSQNGFDNSGQKTSDPSWYRSQLNVDRARAIIQRLANTYKDSTVVTAISVMNEPAPQNTRDPDGMLAVTRQYWYDTYQDVRHPTKGGGSQSNTMLVISDAFKGLGYWKDSNLLTLPDYEGVIVDIHRYQMFEDEVSAIWGEISLNDEQIVTCRCQALRRTNDQHLDFACSQGAELRNSTLWVVVGEWTPAATDCAKYLNSRNVDSRYSDQGYGDCARLTGSALLFDEGYKAFLARHWEAQASTFEQYAKGWIQWTWKTEIADEWSYKAGLKYGWIKRIERSANSSYPNPQFCANRVRATSSAPGRSPLYYAALIFLVIFVFCTFL
ncbi:hypothetical protein H2248_011397 [Termitomyces sp. 'cryptogamus']|nr:hypothetical protein H2248_011397 [Termitomyces sp. 'cryptogamus']